MIFKQKTEGNVIHDCPNQGPTFAGNRDLVIVNQCQNSACSFSNLGGAFTNDTGIAATKVFTGDHYFTVKEIEVFELVSWQ
jgi:hypothetical protein